MEFISKPVTIEAYQWLGPSDYQPGVKRDFDVISEEYYVTTIHEQRVYIEPGDYIIQEPDKIHYYPCKPDIFEKRYEKAR